MHSDTTICVFLTGHRSPVHVWAPPAGLASALVVDISSLLLVVAVDRPSVVDIDFLIRGGIKVTLDREKKSAILTWQLSQPATTPILLDTPLYVGLEDSDRPPCLSPKGLAAGESRALTVVVQDDAGVVRAMRLVAMPTVILKHLAPLIVRQVAERRDPKFKPRHFGALQDYYARTQSPARAFVTAPVRARVA